MKIVALVTGGTGFIGYHLCKFLFENGYHVMATGVQGENNPFCHKLYRLPLDNLPHQEMGQVDICFHQAANNNTIESNLDMMIESNVQQPSILFRKLLQENNCKNFVYASSCSVYGDQSVPFHEEKTKPNPLNVYAQSKLLFERFAEDFALNNQVKAVGLRYTNVYGKYENHKEKRASMIFQILEKCIKKETIKLFYNGEQLRDWVHVDDVVKANIKAANYSGSGIFNVGYGRSCSFNHLVETISYMISKNPKIKYIPCNFIKKYQFHTAVDLFKSNNQLGFYPEISLPEGVRLML